MFSAAKTISCFCSGPTGKSLKTLKNYPILVQVRAIATAVKRVFAVLFGAILILFATSPLITP